jgi:hypothetical protein
MFLTTSAYAAVKVIPLKTSANVAITDLALTSGVPVLTNTISIVDSRGEITLLLLEDQGGGTGDIDVLLEFSNDGSTWYAEQVRTDEVGTAVARVVKIGLQNETSAFTLSHPPAKFMRINFDPDANSELTATLMFFR